jgi:hypothetical protein
MNWGKAIILSFILFAAFILTIVYRMMTQQVDLVKDDYYKEELNYQQQINRISNAKHHEAAILKHSPETNQINVSLPADAKKGEITFFRPSDKNLDFKKTFDNTHSLQLSTKNMAKGRWKVQIFWSDNQQEYYKEEEIFI